jgi:hypothetical protein
MALLSEAAKDTLERYLRHPLVGAATTVLGTIAGFYGSLNSATLNQHFPLTLALPETFVVVGFWFLIFLFGILLMSIIWAQSRRTRLAHEELATANKELRLTVDDLHSLPSRKFLGDFRDSYYAVARTTMVMIDRGADAQELERYIRSLLHTVISLVQSHHMDEVDQKCRYAANIMLARNVRNVSDTQVNALRKLLRFCDADTLDVRRLQCILEVDRDLSHASDTNDASDPDPKLSHFALPIHVPSENDDNGPIKFPNLIPGAPMTFTQQEPRNYVDQRQLIAETEASNMSPRAKQEIKQFMESAEGQRIQSFLSIPLLWWRPEDKLTPEGARCLGVLTIRRDRPGIFPGQGFKRFHLMISPFTFEIAKIIEHMRERGYPKYSNRGI